MGLALRRLILSIKSVGWWGRFPEFLSLLSLASSARLKAFSPICLACVPSAWPSAGPSSPHLLVSVSVPPVSSVCAAGREKDLFLWVVTSWGRHMGDRLLDRCNTE